MNPNFTNSNPINPTMAVNDDKTRALKQFNTFDMDYSHPLTARFGDETPFYVFDSWSKDTVPLGSFHELFTEALNSRLVSDINMHKSYFSVPYKAIYPNTWDRFIVHPNIGDDVPQDIRNNVFSSVDVLNYFKRLFIAYSNGGFTSFGDSTLRINVSLRHLLLVESYFSRGGLLSYLGCKLTKYIHTNYSSSPQPFDVLIDLFFDKVKSLLSENSTSLFLRYGFEDDGTFQQVRYSPDVDHTIDQQDYVSWHRFLELMRDNTDFRVVSDKGNILVLDEITDLLVQIIGSFSLPNVSIIKPVPINHSRLIAYQLVANHFVSNDHVDDIYSADTWRDKINNILYSSDDPNIEPLHSSPLMFSYNGTRIMYDHYSGYVMNLSFDKLVDTSIVDSDGTDKIYLDFMSAYNHIYELHRWCKSLKFGDYFNGARSAPYAVGDLSAPVVGDGVSAIEMTKNIQMQRFANSVIKLGRRTSDYFKGIFDTALTPVITDPKFIARDTQTLGVENVENTANNQGNVVSLLRSEQSRFAFEVDITDPAIIIGTLSFSAVRPYCNVIERFFFHKNRFDFFNPFMQYTGDQMVYRAEKLAGNIDDAYAYQMRYAEYKQRVPQVSGGIVDYLKSWFFIADDSKDGEDETNHISSQSIRSSNAEFDRFFASSANSSLAGYFHFVFNFNNISRVNRNMDATPTIL